MKDKNTTGTVAGPELLEALIEALPWVEAQLDDPINKPGAVRAVVNRIRAAIAKAESRPEPMTAAQHNAFPNGRWS